MLARVLRAVRRFIEGPYHEECGRPVYMHWRYVSEDALNGFREYVGCPEKELVHFTWADEENEAYCGADVSGERWADDGEDVNCVKCLQMECGQPQLKSASCRHCGKAWIDRMPLGADEPLTVDPADCRCACHG